MSPGDKEDCNKGKVSGEWREGLRWRKDRKAVAANPPRQLGLRRATAATASERSGGLSATDDLGSTEAMAAVDVLDGGSQKAAAVVNKRIKRNSRGPRRDKLQSQKAQITNSITSVCLAYSYT